MSRTDFMFSIGFTDGTLEYPFDDPTVPAAPGSLVLGKCKEDFLANLSLWSRSAYQSHWIGELKLIFGGQPKAVLVVSYDDPTASSNMELWRIYREGEWLHFQNQLLRYSSLPQTFDISQVGRYIPERVVMTEDGNRISEWDVHISDLETFLWRSGAL